MKKIAIIISKFNELINQNLLNGALNVIKETKKIKKKHINIIWVPGALEIPLITKLIAKSKKYKAIIALGTIIKGETQHNKYITSNTYKNILKISIKFEIPIICGILTTNNIEQAIHRAGGKLGNKGKEAALIAINMIKIIKKIKNNQ